jgi:hypothetical protein
MKVEAIMKRAATTLAMIGGPHTGRQLAVPV